MNHKLLPEWIRPALETRFIDRAKGVADLAELEEPRDEQFTISAQLQEQLAPRHYQMVLKWEEIINHRCTLEKEELYYAGVRDGLLIWKSLLKDISE